MRSLYAILMVSCALTGFSPAESFGAKTKAKAAVSSSKTRRVASAHKSTLLKITPRRRALVFLDAALVGVTMVTVINQRGAASDYEAQFASIDATTEDNRLILLEQKNRVDSKADIARVTSLFTLASLGYTTLVWKSFGPSGLPQKPSGVSLHITPSGPMMVARVGF